MDMKHLLLVNVLGLELGSLISDRLYSMMSDETPQGVPDGVLFFHVEPLINKVIQGLYVDIRQVHS